MIPKMHPGGAAALWTALSINTTIIGSVNVFLVRNWRHVICTIKIN